MAGLLLLLLSLLLSLLHPARCCRAHSLPAPLLPPRLETCPFWPRPPVPCDELVAGVVANAAIAIHPSTLPKSHTLTEMEALQMDVAFGHWLVREAAIENLERVYLNMPLEAKRDWDADVVRMLQIVEDVRYDAWWLHPFDFGDADELEAAESTWPAALVASGYRPYTEVFGSSYWGIDGVGTRVFVREPYSVFEEAARKVKDRDEFMRRVQFAFRNVPPEERERPRYAVLRYRFFTAGAAVAPAPAEDVEHLTDTRMRAAREEMRYRMAQALVGDSSDETGVAVAEGAPGPIRRALAGVVAAAVVAGSGVSRPTEALWPFGGGGIAAPLPELAEPYTIRVPPVGNATSFREYVQQIHHDPTFDEAFRNAPQDASGVDGWLSGWLLPALAQAKPKLHGRGDRVHVPWSTDYTMAALPNVPGMDDVFYSEVSDDLGSWAEALRANFQGATAARVAPPTWVVSPSEQPLAPAQAAAQAAAQGDAAVRMSAESVPWLSFGSPAPDFMLRLLQPEVLDVTPQAYLEMRNAVHAYVGPSGVDSLLPKKAALFRERVGDAGYFVLETRDGRLKQVMQVEFDKRGNLVPLSAPQTIRASGVVWVEANQQMWAWPTTRVPPGLRDQPTFAAALRNMLLRARSSKLLTPMDFETYRETRSRPVDLGAFESEVSNALPFFLDDAREFLKSYNPARLVARWWGGNLKMEAKMRETVLDNHLVYAQLDALETNSVFRTAWWLDHAARVELLVMAHQFVQLKLGPLSVLSYNVVLLLGAAAGTLSAVGAARASSAMVAWAVKTALSAVPQAANLAAAGLVVEPEERIPGVSHQVTDALRELAKINRQRPHVQDSETTTVNAQTGASTTSRHITRSRVDPDTVADLEQLKRIHDRREALMDTIRPRAAEDLPHPPFLIDLWRAAQPAASSFIQVMGAQAWYMGAVAVTRAAGEAAGRAALGRDDYYVGLAIDMALLLFDVTVVVASRRRLMMLQTPRDQLRVADLDPGVLFRVVMGSAARMAAGTFVQLSVPPTPLALASLLWAAPLWVAGAHALNLAARRALKYPESLEYYGGGAPRTESLARWALGFLPNAMPTTAAEAVAGAQPFDAKAAYFSEQVQRDAATVLEYFKLASRVGPAAAEAHQQAYNLACVRLTEDPGGVLWKALDERIKPGVAELAGHTPAHPVHPDTEPKFAVRCSEVTATVAFLLNDVYGWRDLVDPNKTDRMVHQHLDEAFTALLKCHSPTDRLPKPRWDGNSELGRLMLTPLGQPFAAPPRTNHSTFKADRTKWLDERQMGVPLHHMDNAMFEMVHQIVAWLSQGTLRNAGMHAGAAPFLDPADYNAFLQEFSSTPLTLGTWAQLLEVDAVAQDTPRFATDPAGKFDAATARLKGAKLQAYAALVRHASMAFQGAADYGLRLLTVDTHDGLPLKLAPSNLQDWSDESRDRFLEQWWLHGTPACQYYGLYSWVVAAAVGHTFGFLRDRYAESFFGRRRAWYEGEERRRLVEAFKRAA